MEDSLTKWIQFSGNIVGGLVILYWIVQAVRYWGGTPELKVLKDEFAQNHRDIQALIRKL